MKMPTDVVESVRATRNSSTQNPLKIWKWPEAGKSYILAANPAMETYFSAIEVIDAETGEQCAEYAGCVGPEGLAPIILDLARRYNCAEVAVEVNNIGIVTNEILVLRNRYENIYGYERIDRITGKPYKLYGWWTTGRVKDQMVAIFLEDIRSSQHLVHSQELMDEIIKWDEDGCERDDRLMAFMIANAVRHEKLLAMVA